ncbi:nitrogen regulatory protein PII [Chloropicon roscoffensis]|uniref:Nitrogen regulatory protein PII n=2 Tax=Chloropicon roscoffensis TaxID=1461544 RepID=A0AAX4PD50_9CHLO
MRGLTTMTRTMAARSERPKLRRAGATHARRSPLSLTPRTRTLGWPRRALAKDSESIASLEAFPACEFFEVKAIVRPWRQDQVVSALLEVGVRGLTCVNVKGIGVQGATKERFMGKEYGKDDLVDKVQISIVVSRTQVQRVCSAVIDSARTGEIGDGKIFIHPVSDVIRIRTKERGAVSELPN